MSLSLNIGLALSLLGAPLLLLGFKALRIDSLSLISRVALWLLAGTVLAFATYGSGSWSQQIGIQAPTAIHLAAAVFAAFAMLAIWPIAQHLQKSYGGVRVEQTESFQKIARFSFGRRLFLVVTAAVVEEILYRSYAIGIGQTIWGSMMAAVVVSLGVFVAAHFQWGVSHLFFVFWAGLVLSLLFVFTNNIWACMLAHAIVDAVGLLLAPAAMARKRTRVPPSTHTG